MNEELGLRLLANLLEWGDEARREYPWLKFMARYKYDGYHDFVAGKRFLESLISWLRQFPSVLERRSAYDFVRKRLVYLGPAELHHLVRRSYYEVIRPRLIAMVASQLSVAEHLVWSDARGKEAYRRLLRRTLFFGLSDGARIDVFRRANTGVISNEQVLLGTQVHEAKWWGVLRSLHEEQGPDARFEFVFLLDDFTGSGLSLVRSDSATGTWTGKLVRFWEEIKQYVATHLASTWELGVHHYVGSYEAAHTVVAREVEIRAARAHDEWFPEVRFSFGTVLPERLKLVDSRDAAILKLADRYYDPTLETRHTEVGGGPVARGFGKCALPLVLDHNTPNNSIALLWAETAGLDGNHAMRPLFRRRQRHV
jgi:hypothetical protein